MTGCCNKTGEIPVAEPAPSTFKQLYFWAACSWRPFVPPLESAKNWGIMLEVACNGKTKHGWIASLLML
jgi:hypothetical protein